MKIDLTNQTVAVFGAARGIGRAIAEGFLQSAANVVGIDVVRGNTGSDQSAADLPFDCLQGDVTCQDDLTRLAAELGPIDHLVFAVGIGSGEFGFPFWNVSPDAWARVLHVNLIGAARVAHAFAPAMAERGRGSLLFLTSVAGQIGSQTDPPYSASKAGLINFMQCVAKDLAPRGVRANAIAPGMVKTQLNRAVWQAGQQRLPLDQRVDYDSWASEKIAKLTPLGRWQEPSEFAAMAVFLASDQARNITGQTFNIDGGWVMR